MRYLLCVLVLLASLPAASRADNLERRARQAEADRVFVEAVDKAIARGVRHLYREQNDGGDWEIVRTRDTTGRGDAINGSQWGGLTALVTYALLATGEDPQDERVQEAVRFLMEADIVGNYALGCRAQVWPYLPTSDRNDDPVKQAALRDARLLLSNLQKAGKNRGLYDYLGAQTDRVDMSVSQYGVLGMWAASDYVEIPPGYWVEVEQAWLRWQQPDGGWAYKGRPDLTGNSRAKPVTMSMTVAGIATLYLTQDFTTANQPARTAGNARNPAVDKAMELVVEHYPELIKKVQSTEFTLRGGGNYALYGVERVGVASGRKYFDDLDWYREGAQYLLNTQDADGSWGRDSDTCFALLFLARGREPVMMNKAQYVVSPKPDVEIEGRWNQRPRDLANASRWVGKSVERTLNWQVIDLAAGNTRDLHDAPILLLTGDQPLKLTADATEKVRRYLLEGGLLVLNPDGNKRRFGTSVPSFLAELFPEEMERETWSWRPLPAEHPIYTGQQFKAGNWKRLPQTMALTNGVRELVILLPNDAAADWQTYNTKREESFELAANLYQYAIDKTQAYVKGDTHLTYADPDESPSRMVTLARVRHAGNWQPEPVAWEQVAAVAHNAYDLAIETEPVELEALDAGAHPVAHLTGTGDFSGDPAMLARYVEAGGTLIVDAAGGDATFAVDVEQALREAFGAGAVDAMLDNPLPEDHPLYAAGGELGEVRYRSFTAERVPGRLDTPRLRGLEVDGRLAVIYSPLDLTNAMLGAPVDGVTGYDPATAQKLMAKAVLFTVDAK